MDTHDWKHRVLLSSPLNEITFTVQTLDMIIGELTPDQAIQYILDYMSNRTPIKYGLLKQLFTIAAWDISEYRWIPVELHIGETLEHAYRRVQLGSSVITDTVDVVLIKKDELAQPTDTLF